MNGEHFCMIGLSLPCKRSYQSMSALARPVLKGTACALWANVHFGVSCKSKRCPFY